MHPWSTGSASQPNGVTLFPWSEGKQHVVWDYTCHDTVCQSYVGGTSKEAGKAAEEAELAKNEHNDVAAKFVVVPIAKETFGSWGTLSLHFIRQIGARIAARTGNKRATYDLLQNISMTVQLGNIASILEAHQQSVNITSYSISDIILQKKFQKCILTVI